MKTKIISTYFSYPWENTFQRLLPVFKYSVKENMPEAELEIVNLDYPRNNIDSVKLGFISNTIKLRAWNKALQEAECNIIFTDSDMVILQDLSVAFDEGDFDVAYTITEGNGTPINGGVMFARPTEAAKEFFRLMDEINFKMFKDTEFHNKYHKKYMGINQCAIGYLLENPHLYEAKVQALPCSVYNSVDCNWATINEETRALHIKAKLRELCLSTIDYRFVPQRYREAVQIYRTYQRMSKGKT